MFLIIPQQFPPHDTYNSNWIINLSELEIPDVVLKNLSLGNKYNFPYIGNSELPIVDIIKKKKCCVKNIQYLRG